MKKFFIFATAMFAVLSVNAQTLIFDADTVKAAGEWSNGYKWEVGDAFELTLVDTKGKMAIDANNAYFGTAEKYLKLQSRLKSGGKSAESGENSIEIEVYQAGLLSVAVRTGSNSAEDRNLIISQNGEQLFNQIIKEADAVKVKGLDADEPEKETNIYPIVSCNVGVGTVILTYPVGGLNFYAFAIGEIDPSDAGRAVDNVNAAVKAEKFFRNGQLIIRKNGVEYNALGAQL